MRFSKFFMSKMTKYFMARVKQPRTYMCDFDKVSQELRMSDVLLVEGTLRVSQMIQRSTMSPWSHSALYIGRLHDINDPVLREEVHKASQFSPHEQLLIESQLGDGTIISSLTRYKDCHVRICRPAGLSHQDAQAVVAKAISYLGKEYNLRHVIDLWRFLLKAKCIPRSFASSLFKDGGGGVEKEICSVMIAKAFGSIDFPILPLVRKDDQEQFELIHRNSKLFAPSDFDYSPYFDIIKYPIFQTVSHPFYRDLPWRKDLKSNDEEGISNKDHDE